MTYNQGIKVMHLYVELFILKWASPLHLPSSSRSSELCLLGTGFHRSSATARSWVLWWRQASVKMWTQQSLILLLGQPESRFIRIITWGWTLSPSWMFKKYRGWCSPKKTAAVNQIPCFSFSIADMLFSLSGNMCSSNKAKKIPHEAMAQTTVSSISKGYLINW